MDKFDEAVKRAAKSVRAELIRLDYVEGADEPDEEDMTIALAAIRTFLTTLFPPSHA